MNNNQSSSQPFSSPPPFTGTFSTEEAIRLQVADDFGHVLHQVPQAVLRPHTLDDIINVVQFARQHGLNIAPRGQGHSTYGQAQTREGIVVDTASLNAIHAIDTDCVEVEAGVRLVDLLRATLAYNLTPPVLPDYPGLSIGGLLSVGGVGDSSYRYGAFVDQVQELQVVTGKGKQETCSLNQHPELFASVLAGLGQYGIIVKATLKLIPVKPYARVFRVFYPTLAALIHDANIVLRESRANGMRSYIGVLPEEDEWEYMLEFTTFYTSSADQPDATHLFRGLNFLHNSEQIEEMTYFDYCNRVTPEENWNLVHPWLAVFLPASTATDYVNDVLANLSPAESRQDVILLHAFNANRLHKPLLRVPKTETFFLFSLLRTLPPDSSQALALAVTYNRMLIERCWKLGGTHYPIGTIDLTQKDWKTHYGPCWEQVVQMKQRFDPDHLLTPGQSIFPPI
jgi:FAD/FMN-containing dehydrogenase